MRPPDARSIRRRWGWAIGTAIVGGWIAPLVYFWRIVWLSDRPAPMVGCLLAMAASLLAIALPARFFRPMGFEAGGRVYERLGIRAFHRLMGDGPLMNRAIRRADPSFRVLRRRNDLPALAARTRLAEQAHWIWFVLGIPPTLAALILGWPKYAALLLVSNVAVNLYPILLQRYLRARIVALEAHRRAGRPASSASGLA